MKRILFASFICYVSLIAAVSSQCEFPDYDNYGLTCSEARFLCGYEMDGYNGTLLVDKSPGEQPNPLCSLSGGGEADNIQWYSFITDDVNVEIVIRYSSCTNNILQPGLQVGIFENCILNSDSSPMGSIYCVEDINYTDLVLAPDPSIIEVGQLYYLYIDGYAGSACDFEIDVISGICTEAPEPDVVCEQDCGVISEIAGYTSCTMFSDSFSFSPSSQLISNIAGCNPDLANTRLEDILCIDWEIEPNMGFNVLSSSLEYFDSLDVTSTLSLEWSIPGTYTIKPEVHINPLFSTCEGICTCSDDVAYTIVVTESSIITNPDIELCPGECVDFCGQSYCSPGTQQCFNREECIIETVTLVNKSITQVDLGELYLCPGDCFEFQGALYCDANTYEVVDVNFCDTIFSFQLDTIALSSFLIADENMLNCSVEEVYLEGAWETNFTGDMHSFWLSENGDTVSYESIYITSEPGEYTFVAFAEGFEQCPVTWRHKVEKDVSIPTVDLIAPFLTCSNSTDSFVIQSQDNIVSAEWTGPNGFISTELTPEITTSGEYNVTFTAENGCKVNLSSVVDDDFSTPEIQLEYNNWTCSEVIPFSSFNSLSALDSFFWRLPDGSSSTDEALQLSLLGTYALNVVGANGCDEVIEFTVEDLSYDPALQLDEDRMWRCTDTEIVLDLSKEEVSGVNYSWTNLEGALLANSINITIDGPGTYILTSFDPLLECLGTDTVYISENPNPLLDFNIITSPPICAEEPSALIDVETIQGGEAPFLYEVNGEMYDDLSVVGFVSGAYEVTVWDALGCGVTKNIEVAETEAITLEIEPYVSVRFGKTETLTFETNLSHEKIALIEWVDQDGMLLGINSTVEFVAKDLEFVDLYVEDLNGCSATTRVEVDIDYEIDIFYPNVFSPNGDGRNEVFTLYNNGYPEIADGLKVFSRSGELIYESSKPAFNDAQLGWDGSFNGRMCQPGVYVFIVEYTLMNGEHKTFSGTITLVR